MEGEGKGREQARSKQQAAAATKGGRRPKECAGGIGSGRGRVRSWDGGQRAQGRGRREDGVRRMIRACQDSSVQSSPSFNPNR